MRMQLKRKRGKKFKCVYFLFIQAVSLAQTKLEQIALFDDTIRYGSIYDGKWFIASISSFQKKQDELIPIGNTIT